MKLLYAQNCVSCSKMQLQQSVISGIRRRIRMATTITTDNVKTIYALDAVTSLADADDLIVWDSTNSVHKKITRADLQTDIASRSEANLATLAAITTAGTILPDGKAVGELYTYTCQRLRLHLLNNVLTSTGINVNGGENNNMLLIMMASHSFSGNGTASRLYLVRLGYDGDHYTPSLIASSLNDDTAVAFSLSSSVLNITLSGGSGHAIIIGVQNIL